MKTFEITTPVLNESIALFRRATDGTMDTKEAANHIAAGNGITKAVGQELKVRLAMPRLAAMEAKMIEADREPQGKQIGKAA